MLTVRDLSRPGLEPVSFELETGECVALQGPSGAGKTLLLRALADLDPSEGRVDLDGTERSSVTGPEWRRRVTYVAAEPGWWAETVGDHFADWAAAEALRKALLLSEIERTRSVQSLSTGERQRFAIIRALLLEPSVLLLDEPTGPLDDDATSAVEAQMAEARKNGTAIFWVTHDRAQAERVAERVLMISDGEVTGP